MSDTRNRGARRSGATTSTVGDISDARDRSAFEFKGKAADESIPELLRQLIDQGTHLAEKQAQLVQAEVRDSVNDMKMAAGAMAGAAVVGIAGLGVLLMGLAFLLAEVMACRSRRCWSRQPR